MARQITSIKIQKNTVYVNFDNGTFGTHTYNKESGKWITAHLTAEELTAVRKLSIKNGNYTNWQVARPQSRTNVKQGNEDYEHPLTSKEINDLESRENMRNEDINREG